ncbi:MAG TPA: GNAT family N-acetyltransferase [Stellaceae bacterium]|jgi:ribosomal protein S18 acetylase RimI-like enzyme|nr:GNAT family N-acetyltransferase [Stellaceae bacterium]
MEYDLRPPALRIRPAAPADVPALFRLKQALTKAEGNEAVLRATAADWLRDGFGTQARFASLVAESGGTIVGMLTYSEFYLTALADVVLSIQDLFVEPAHRRSGAGRALLATLAAHAVERRIPLIQLNVQDDNPARPFYRRAGFQHLRGCLTYAVGGRPMQDLAAGTIIDPTAAVPET